MPFIMMLETFAESVQLVRWCDGCTPARATKKSQTHSLLNLSCSTLLQVKPLRSFYPHCRTKDVLGAVLVNLCAVAHPP
jgi:hypothetical protein